MIRVLTGTTLGGVILAAAGCASPEASAPGPPQRPRAVLLRAGFRAAGASADEPASWRHIPLHSELDAADSGAASELDRVLSTAPDVPNEPWPAPVRSYEIELAALPDALWERENREAGLVLTDTVYTNFIVIEDAGGRFCAMRQAGGSESDAAVAVSPEFAELLRRESYEALRASMEPPLFPLEWSHAALAGFLDSVPSGIDVKALRAELLSALRANPEASYLAEVLIEKAASFPPGELEPLLGEEALAPKLLALTGKASRGDARALEEILTLSLEHFGSGALFERSLRTLFPQATNPGLHARHSGAGPARGSFVEAVRAGARAASFDEREGWALER